MSIYEYDEKEHIRLERTEAREEGREEGEDALARLIRTLLKDGRTDVVALVIEDKSQREHYYREYNIKK